MTQREKHLLQLIIQGNIQGKKQCWQMNVSQLKILHPWFGKNSMSLFCTLTSKEEIALMATKFQEERRREEGGHSNPLFSIYGVHFFFLTQLLIG